MNTQVAIVGAGPSGCSAALKCSNLGVPVVLFEARGRYRDKPCGDALLAEAVNYVRSFGLTDSDFLGLGGQPFNHMDFELARNPPVKIRRPHPGGWVIPRMALDQALRDSVSSSCVVRYNTAVRAFRPTDSGVEVTVSGEGHGSEQFAAVIIATGAAARLSYSLNIDGLPTKAMAFRGYAPNPRKCDALQFEFNGESITQYRWAFPVGDKSNVGAFRVEQAIREPQAALRALAGRVRGTEKLAGGIEPLWSAIANNWHHEWGIVSCGDCAGLVDPITGEGITAAFVSGEMAAVSIAEYLNERRVDALERFSLRIKEVFSTKYNNYRAEDFLALFSPVG